jgi:NADPH:quinone reductase-like Zn-dependent oxidoreductase
MIWASPSKTAAICLRDRFVDSASCLNISDFVRPLGDFFTVMAAPSRNVDTETNPQLQGGRVESGKANVNQNYLENEAFFLPACSWQNRKYILFGDDPSDLESAVYVSPSDARVLHMKAIVFDCFGDPAEVLQVRDIPVPEPGWGEVRVRMICSPINPSDLSVVRGEYGRLPDLPATPGFEGAGVVEATGGGILGKLRQGRRVAVLNGKGGSWQEYVIVPAKQAVPVPSDLKDEQAATFFVNPASALAMIQYVLKVPSGAWVLQTAAGSALGRMVIRLGRHLGFRTINVVRRREQVQELLHAGGDAVICSCEDSIEEWVQKITGGQGVSYALDAVGGATAAAVVKSLSQGGRLLLYGTLSGEPLQLDPRVLMSGSRKIEGFWLSNWASQQGVMTMLLLFRRINKLLAAGILTTEVGDIFPMTDIQTAVREAVKPGRQGKVLLRLSSGG